MALRPLATSTPTDNQSKSRLQPIPKPIPQAAATPLSLTVPADELFGLSTAQQFALVVAPPRDLRDLAVRLKPEIDFVPAVVNQKTPVYQIGDIETFSAHNLSQNHHFSLEAELIHITDVAYVWVEKDQQANQEAIIASIDRFSRQSYPKEVALFGSEWNPGVDNDPRLHILHAVGIGSGVAGYYSSADEYSRLANPFSNEKEMFYISLSWLNNSQDFEYYETVLAHELQHMIHWYQDRNEETWINEGLSEYAQEVAGYQPDTIFASSFAARPETQLTTWNEQTGSNSEHYGSAFLFITYLSQRFGADFVGRLVSEPANGIEGINMALQKAGINDQEGPLTFERVFADWVVANYVDDVNALGSQNIYGYQGFTQRAPRLQHHFEKFPVARQKLTIPNHAAHYIRLAGEGDIMLKFNGETTTQLANTSPYSGRLAWWSGRTDDSDSRLTRQFDLSTIEKGKPIELLVNMWWDIETDYDYGYVLASRDGKEWTILEGKHTTIANPSGNSYGAGYTAQSDEVDGIARWVTESYDLSTYAESKIWLRFEYITDDAVNMTGWLIDDISIPALGYQTDFEQDADGWQSEGWLLTDNNLEQRWLLQVLEFGENNMLSAINRYPLNTSGEITIPIDGLGATRSALLIVSALAARTTEPATYDFEIVQQ